MKYVPSVAARTFCIAVVLASFAPSGVRAQQGAAATALPTPVPAPTMTITPLPYPAYGTPAPGVAAQQSKPGIPGSVTLQQAIDIAVALSPAFASERAQYEAVRARYYAEKGALFPSVSGSVSLQRTYGSGSNSSSIGGNGNSGNGSGSSGSMVTSESARVNLTQLIFDGGRVIAGIRSSKEADIAGKQTLLRNLQTLAFNVATAYYSVLEANASIAANAALARQFETQESAVRAQVRAGAAARSDLAAAAYQTASARGALVNAQGAAIGAQSLFATSLGLDADTTVNPQPLGPGLDIKTLDYLGALKVGLALRPDYLAAQHTVESSNENLRFAKLARFPALNLNASDGTGRVTTPALTPYGSGSSLGATLSVPLYDQGLTNYNVAIAASQLDQANAGLVQSKLTVQNDVRGALSNLISARALLVQAQAELASAQVNAQAFQARYRVGAATITDIVLADATLSNAQRDQINALYGERLAEERYEYAVGSIDLKL